MRRISGRAALVVALAVLSAWPVAAGREPAVHALVGARIVIAPGRVVDSGTLVIRDGLIEAVGADVEVPADARVWPLEDATLYPGLIESHRTLDWPTLDEDAEPQGAAENPLVHPERELYFHAHDPDLYAKLHQAGFTTAVLVPEPGLFRGRSVLVNLGDDGPGHEVLRRTVAQNALLAVNADGGYPNSLMGSIALFRQTFLDARRHGVAQAAFERDPRQARPAYDAALAALEGVAAGQEPIVLESRDPAEALRLARLADEFELDAVLVGNGREYQRLDAMVAVDRPWILPVNFPEAPKVDEEKPETADLGALRHWDQAPENPARLVEAGATVAFTSHGLGTPKDLHGHLAKAIERGFDPDRALAALTTVPAKLWGIADRAGTLEPGKMANVVVADGELFTDGVKIRDLWIDGERLELKEIKPPTVDPLGTWDVVIDAGPGGQIPVTVAFAGSVEDLEGTVSTAQGTLPMLDAVVSGDEVEFSIDATPVGMPGTISFVLSVDGDSCGGTGISPQGSFTFSGKRTSRPDPEVIR